MASVSILAADKALPSCIAKSTPGNVSPATVESVVATSTRQGITDSVLSLLAQSSTKPPRNTTEDRGEPKAIEMQLAQRPLPIESRQPTERTTCTFKNRPVFLFPQGDSAPPLRLPRSIPLGLFRDGSVRSLHPEIDPQVYRALKASGLGPLEETLHRSISPYGAPVRMAAGTDPQLLMLVGLQPNWHAATGNLFYTKQSVSIPHVDRWMSAGIIYRHLKEFRDFNQNNLAQVRVIRSGTLDPPVLHDRQFALFRVHLLLETKPLQAHWALANTVQSLVNANPVAVELFYHDTLHMIEAVTLGNHMLSGTRRWQVSKTGLHSVQITSEAWIRPNGKLNALAMQTLGPLAIDRIWSQYLANIANAVKLPGSQIIHEPVIHHEFTLSPGKPPPRLYPWPPWQPRAIRSEDHKELFILPTDDGATPP